MKRALLITAMGAILLAGCAKKEAPPPQQAQKEITEAPPPAPAPQDAVPKVGGDTITTPSGLKYLEVTAGQGPNPTTGQVAQVHYTGWLASGARTKFDSSRDRGGPLEFPFGPIKGWETRHVIKGMEEGVMSMKVGGRRLLIIPPDLAYGPRGIPGGPIPPAATLIFDVELLAVNNPDAKL